MSGKNKLRIIYIIDYPNTCVVGQSIQFFRQSKLADNQHITEIVKTFNVGEQCIQMVIVRVLDLMREGENYE